MSLTEDILAWPYILQGGDEGALLGYLIQRYNRNISVQELNGALDELAQREFIERDGGQLWRTEPDCKEIELYSLLDDVSQSLFNVVDVPVNRVFQCTATGGSYGDGRFTRPDFTLAAIQSWKFDPSRTLEVYSFEVKNRKGSGIPAVYEAVAHGRFVNHPYLVCPRSLIRIEVNEALHDACLREGVGLLLYDLTAEGSGQYRIDNVRLEVKAERRSPDPRLVEQFLEKRLTDENRQRLVSLAAGGAA